MSTDTDLRATVLAAIAEIAPEANLAALPDDADVREELDLDSMDMQSLVVGIYEATGIDVPERDYGSFRDARGLTADPRAFSVPLIVRSLRQADLLSDALRARGIDD